MPNSILFRSYIQQPYWKHRSAIGSCSLGKTNIVKKVLGAIYPTNLRHRAGLPFRILALAGALYAITGAESILAQQNQSGSVSDAKAEVLSISNEELKEFDSALEEPDPLKRAENLYNFIQKRPNSRLIGRITNEDYKRIEIIEAEHRAFYNAKYEPDLEKRATMLLEFGQKNTKSELMQFAKNEYVDMLKQAAGNKEYERLESLGEKWLAVHPHDAEVCTFLAEAAVQLQKYQRCGECLEIVYARNPSPRLAKEIHICYQKADNSAKHIEWAEKILKMPEFDADYMLHYGIMMKFFNEKNLPQASEYARLTLRSADLARPTDENSKEQLRKVRSTSHHIIASELLERGDFSQAIIAFEAAIEAERYAGGYYGIGLCLDRKREIENAFPYYAAAELMGGEEAQKAKDRLEVLYRSLHNDTLVGIDKVYKKARQLLAKSEG